MEIHRVGVSDPITETPAESVAPKESSQAQTIQQQPFQDDAIVSSSSPALDLGISSANYSTIPVKAQTEEESNIEGRTPHHIRPSEDDVLKGVQEYFKQTWENVFKNIR